MSREFFESTADEFCSLDLTWGVNNPVAPDRRECFVAERRANDDQSRGIRQPT